MRPVFQLSALFCIALLGACDKNPIDLPTPSSQPNILFIIADDMGKDAINGFSEGSIKPNTPNIDAIRNSGLSFSNFWVYPTCSPTRASIITGKYGYRTGVKWAADVLSNSETILHQYINAQTNNSYATAVIGKWHLSGDADPTFNPESFGMDHYAGLLRGTVQDYYQWQLTEDGIGTLQTEYATTVFTDLSINWVNEQSKPWFLWLAYNAPHVPFHVPPSEMHSQGNLPAYTAGLDATPYYMAAIEAMDYQIGRLLDNIPADERANTLIIFIGDNGTPNEVAQAPYSSNTVKGTLFQGGINTPMFISGAGVSRTGTDNSLICGTDLYATIAQVAGVSASQIHDSKSFKALFSGSAAIRDFQYSEMDDGTTDAWTIGNGAYKLTVDANGNQTMYDLTNDPYEQDELNLSALSAQQSAAKAALEAELLLIRN